MVNQQAIDQVTHGSYQRELTYDNNVDLVQGTEVEWTELATDVVATAKDELFSWIRYTGYVYYSSDASAFELAVIKCLSTDALQDLNDDAVVELLQKEGKLFTRQTYVQTPYGSVKKITFEFFNVKLKAGEELRMVVRPIFNMTDGIRFSELEFRQVGA